MKTSQGWRPSVFAYVLVLFGACIVCVAAIITNATTASFSRERGRARAELRAAARYNAGYEADSFSQVTGVLNGLARQASITTLDPVTCRTAFEGLDSVADQGSIYLVRGDRSPVCSLLARRRAVVDVPSGGWFARTLTTGEAQYGGVRVDATGVPQVVFAVPVPGAPSPALLVAVLDAAVPPLETPAGANNKTVLVELDKQRRIIVSTSTNAPVKPGLVPRGSWLAEPLGGRVTRTDADGVRRIYQEVAVPGMQRVVLAGLSVDAALAEAREERNQNIVFGALILLVVGGLGFAVQRRIARPLANLRAAIRDAGDDGSVVAAASGPAEVVALADEFNTTMTKRRDLEADLAAAAERASDASRMKSLFLANVSHEIRTPMNGVLGMISLLRDEALTPVQEDYLDTMQGSASALLAIINDLLDFSKIEAGMLQIEQVEFGLEDCVRAAVAPWLPAAKEKRIRLTVSIDPALPARVHGDPHRLRQVLSNLVDNAVKFTLDGAVEVSVTRRFGDVVRVEVRDTGIGLGDRRGDELFDAFVQGDPSTTRRFGGTGLGLAICKQLVTLMQGTIDAQARPDGGTVFWFELPLPASARSQPASVTRAEPRRTRLQGRVLLVEDNSVNQKVARKLLEQLGLDVDVAGDGAEAVNKVRTNDYLVVLMDLQMPGLDGFAATRAIRDELHSGVPIIALSASVLPEDKARCFEAGMDGHLAKPIDRSELRAALERAAATSAW